MSTCWLRFPIYVNGEKRFDENPSGALTTSDSYERMQCVFDNIESCIAEGRLMDMEIFDRLDTLRDQIRDKDIPSFCLIADLVDCLGSRYGFDRAPNSDATWIRSDDSGRAMIWIDRQKSFPESNRRRFG